MRLDQGPIPALENTPSKAQAEDSSTRIARLATQVIGSCEGIHPKVLAAQEAHGKMKRRVAIRSAGEKS